jgi:hypothetical protein
MEKIMDSLKEINKNNKKEKFKSKPKNKKWKTTLN